jgi:hypothetical protein
LPIGSKVSATASKIDMVDNSVPSKGHFGTAELN